MSQIGHVVNTGRVRGRLFYNVSDFNFGSNPFSVYTTVIPKRSKPDDNQFMIGSTSQSFQFTINNDFTWQVLIRMADASFYYVNTVNPVIFGKQASAVFQRDPTTGAITIWVNGVAQSITYTNGPIAGAMGAATDLFVGAYDSNGLYPFKGALQNVRVCSGLSSLANAQAYAANVAAVLTGVIADWYTHTASGVLYADQSGNGHHLFVDGRGSTYSLSLEKTYKGCAGIKNVVVHNTTPRTIDAKYWGTHAYQYPNGTTNRPTVPYGIYRTLSNQGIVGRSALHWYLTEVDLSNIGAQSYRNISGKGMCNWTPWDTCMTELQSQGKRACHPMGTCPTWASARPNEVSQYRYSDNLPNVGCMAEPADMQNFADHCAALATRNVNNWGSTIQYYEVCNEPSYSSNPPWFSGTAAKNAEMARIMTQVIKPIQPDAIILSPGFIYTEPTDNDIGSLVTSQFLNASAQGLSVNGNDGTGTTGKDWIDGFAYHAYTSFFDQMSMLHQTLFFDKITKAALTAAGVPNMPIYMTECGVYLDSLTQTQRERYIRTFMMMGVVLGYQSMIHFELDLGQFALISPANTGSSWDVSSTWTALYNEMVGKTMTDGTIEMHDGRIYVGITFSDGSFIEALPETFRE